MTERRIRARVRRDGTTTLDVTHGPGGAGCLDMLAPFERALGGDAERTEKAEMWHEASADAAETVEEGR